MQRLAAVRYTDILLKNPTVKCTRLCYMVYGVYQLFDFGQNRHGNTDQQIFKLLDQLHGLSALAEPLVRTVCVWFSSGV